MLIGDDDDYDAMLEEGDATMEEEEPPVVETMSSSDAGSIVGEDVASDDISLADFALLPLVYGLVEAHRTKRHEGGGGQNGCTAACRAQSRGAGGPYCSRQTARKRRSRRPRRRCARGQTCSRGQRASSENNDFA